jgi:hypothetical protein
MASLSELLNPTAMDEHDYATLPSMGEGAEDADTFSISESLATPSGGMGGEGDGGHLLLKEQGYNMRIQNLDVWFTSLYSYFKAGPWAGRPRHARHVIHCTLF